MCGKREGRGVGEGGGGRQGSDPAGFAGPCKELGLGLYRMQWEAIGSDLLSKRISVPFVVGEERELN